MLDGFLVVPPYLGKAAVDVVVDLGLGDADLFRDGGLGRPGHLHLEDLGASILRRQAFAVIHSHDLVTPPTPPGLLQNAKGRRPEP